MTVYHCPRCFQPNSLIVEAGDIFCTAWELGSVSRVSSVGRSTRVSSAVARTGRDWDGVVRG